MYAAFLTLFMKSSSISAYVQGVIFGHRLAQVSPPSYSDPCLKMVLRGAAAVQSSPPAQKDPILATHLLALHKCVDMNSPIQVLTWAAVLLMHRALLRVSHIVKSPHTLKAGDIFLTPWGMLIRIRSSKTVKTDSNINWIPITSLPVRTLCPVFWVSQVLAWPRVQDAALFSTLTIPEYTYHVFARIFRTWIRAAGLHGAFSSHSLRRGGATSMAASGCSLLDIKTRGQWSSDAVFTYLRQSLSSKLSADIKFATNL